MRKKILVLVVSISFLSVSSGCIDNNNKTVTWTAKEVWDDYVTEGNSSFFVSLDHGDTIRIRDNITKLEAGYQYKNESITYVSLTDGQYPLPVEGNLSDEYQIGNEVLITLHIIEIETPGEKIEFFKEMWDGNDVKPMPRSAIKQI
jgi:hypothetical protein